MFHKHSVSGYKKEANHNAGQEYPGKQTYAAQNHTHQGEELLAKSMLSSQQLNPKPVGVKNPKLVGMKNPNTKEQKWNN